MPSTRFLLKFLSALIIILCTVLASCTKDDQTPENKYFISKKHSVSYPKAYMSSMLDAVSQFAPEILDLKPLIASDIDIYKIIYKTTIDSVQLNASGLVCAPATPGNYPVLSFQNGTNTLHANAPSVFPDNYAFQLIEIIASMGYIVVIPDYPGFGESSQIPHPYLVAEPTVRSIIDMFYAVKELAASELPGITQKNEYYLLGYSQGGWATAALHKSIELAYYNDFNLAGSACGAGPYDISGLLQQMINAPSYPMPVYLGYILNAYKSYEQFTNPVTDIFREPYASRLDSLYTGLLSSGEINSRLTTSIPGLLNPDFLSDYSDPKYNSIRLALINNSVLGWHTYKPLLLIHGANDTHVNPISTENMYVSMMQAGTAPEICQKVIIPGVDHGEGAFPSIIRSIKFLNDLKISK
jgi:pimeloyl-ACP methyl ester carboxylesterase